MGIRIHKCLGYALNDVKVEKYQVIDERFNLVNGWFADREESEEPKPEEYFEHLKKVDKELNEKGDYSMLTMEINDFKCKEKHRPLYSCFVYDFEFGRDNVVMFQPYVSQDWSRYDDIIDYYDVDDSYPKLKLLKRPIYPYESWINLKDHSSHFKTEKHCDILWSDIINIANNPVITEPDTYANLYGFKTLQEMNENIVPIIPEALIELLKFTKVFKDEKTIHTLKPAIYTFWS